MLHVSSFPPFFARVCREKLTTFKEHIGEAPSIAFTPDLGKLIHNSLGLLVSIAIGGNLEAKKVRRGKCMIVLEIVHVIIGDRRFFELGLD